MFYGAKAALMTIAVLACSICIAALVMLYSVLRCDSYSEDQGCSSMV